ncbi:hypothetical protein GGR50DRAFT_693845 [Xylaria sp. CBS 124048]|nr:hypothetical protein GGR50DRAFT_693845 [Xylaria sp. CBS 124048]
MHSHSPDAPVWYFAYGCNMSSAKFTGGRGLVPLDTARVRLPNWVLAMEIPGLPYAEPSFASIVPRPFAHLEERRAPDVVGVAYLITPAQYRHVIASEGGGTAYTDLCLDGERIDGKDGDDNDNTEKEKSRLGIRVRTLGSAMSRHPHPNPSQRYMSLIVDGASEAHLPRDYLDYLASMPVFTPSESPWTRLGATIFVFFGRPIMQAIEKLTNKSIRPDGTATAWAVFIVRLTMYLLWLFHDFLFAPIFGRGDGL